MTKDKDFKTAVRARMEKTGERYAAARANLAAPAAPGWRAIAGQHGETTALARLAAAAGLTMPHTKAPPSEALLLGLGGGIGGAYFVFEYKGVPPSFYVATRCFPQYAYGAGFVTTAAERVGLDIEVIETGSKAAAAKQLAERAAAGPVMAWLDRSSLPWGQPLPGSMGVFPHTVVVDGALVRDVGATAFELAPAQLAAARAKAAKEKHRMIVAAGAAKVDLGASCLAAIDACVVELGGKKPPFAQFKGNFGVPGLAKWAALAADPKDKKGWAKVFPGGIALWNALTWGWFWIEAAGTGGGGFRPMYAAFLDEARVITGRTSLGDAAAAYRALGAQWSGVAAAMLPDGVPLLRETRTALAAQRKALLAGDTAGVIAQRAAIETLRTRAGKGELEGDAAAAIRADVSGRLRTLVAAETEAIRSLET